MKTYDLPQVSPEEYLLMEEAAEYKHEYRNGEIFAMSGVSPKHSVISHNFREALSSRLKKTPCLVFDSDVKLAIEARKSYVYPDGMVVCGELEYSDKNKNIIKNPKVVFEVLSDSTEGYDRGEKFFNYRSIPSLQEYILISQHERRVEVFFRKKGDNVWQMRSYEDIEEAIILQSLKIEVPFADVYQKTQSFE